MHIVHQVIDGSLTTPPCSESVSWVVMAEPIEMSSEQIHTFMEVFSEVDEFPDGNHRLLQPLNELVVLTNVNRN